METSLTRNTGNAIEKSGNRSVSLSDLQRLEMKLDRILATALGDVSQGPANTDEESNSLVQAWHVLYRKKWIIIVACLFCGLAGYLISRVQSPMYEGRALLEILEPNDNPLKTERNLSEGVNFSQDTYIQTRVDLLKSDSVVRRALPQLEAHRHLLLPARTSLAALLGLSEGEEIKKDETLELIEAIQNNMKIRPHRGTTLVELFFYARDPNLAAKAANVLANEFIAQELEVRRQSSLRTKEWLASELDAQKQKLEESENRLHAYAQSAGLMMMGGKDNIAEEKLRRLEEDLTKAQAVRIEKQARYEAAKENPVEALPASMTAGALNEYQVKRTELRRELADLTALYTPDHYRVRRVKAQIDELEAAIAKERAEIVERARSDYEAALAIEQRLAALYKQQSGLVSSQGEKAIRYNVLQREVETNRNLYNAMLQGVKEAGVNGALRAASARIVDAASPPKSPSRPRPVLNVAFGILFGMCFGVAIVLVSDRFDRTVKNPGELSLDMNVAELGVIPAFGGLVSEETVSASLLTTDGPGVRRAVSPTDRWMFAEAFRSTLTSILFSRPDKAPPKVIAVTSCGSGEGKSTVVSSLGLALAEIQRRVLLIGADLRKPSLHTMFGIDNARGLSDWLREQPGDDEMSVESLVVPTRVPGIFVVPSGPGTISPANLLHSPKMAKLIERWREEFDMVILDTPPLLPFADARVLARLSDGVVLVVRSGRTTRDDVRSARMRLQSDNVRLLGSVLNDWHFKSDKSSYFHDSLRYYNPNSSRRGVEMH